MKTTDNWVQKANENELLQKQRETFVTSLSHDLKNPTIAQIRAIELLLKGKFGKISAKQREIIEMVLDSCKYMNAMLGNVLTTYRNEKGTISLNNENVSILNLAVECIDEMIYLAKEKDVNVILENLSDKDCVYGDMVQLRRVIMNLLSNGIKYAYMHTDMFVTVYNEESYTCFKFQNKSPYIPVDRQEKIFARYVSYSRTNNLNGTGIGLYASKKIVEAHNGTIFLKSTEDDVNVFGFRIPNGEEFQNAIRSVTF